MTLRLFQLNTSFLATKFAKRLSVFGSFFFVPTPLVGVGEIDNQIGFFVQSRLADRYIHRREMLVVSLKNTSSVELEIKKTFEEISRLQILC